MTDVRQFGDRAARSLDCGRCEAMLADAVDGVLMPEEQQFFDTHIADCGSCAQLLSEARRGAAWLEMLRTPAPEPSPALLEKILTQTSGTMLHPVSPAQPAPAMAGGYTNVLPFPRRAATALRAGALGRVVFEPRLAMTAAMAFLSVALTLDLMGVNPLNLRAGDLSPSGLHRSFADMNARVVQYYEGLRVVYELESRVHDFENVQENARDASPAAQGQQAPATGDQAPANASPDRQVQPSGSGSSSPSQAQPKGNAPSSDPAAPQQDNPAQPDRKSSVQPDAGPRLVAVRRNRDERERRAA